MAQLTKQPRLILPQVFAFAPNREALGGTAYLIVRNDGNTLVDSPPWQPEYQQFMQDQGGVQHLLLTHRGAIGAAPEIQRTFDCPIVIQEQEAYLLPNCHVISFGDRHRVAAAPELLEIIWTPGHSPGSSCIYSQLNGGILFTGRHLLPDPTGQLHPLRTAKTFHWPRQLASVRQLQAEFNSSNLRYICPGANLGFLRGAAYIEQSQIQPVGDSSTF